MSYIGSLEHRIKLLEAERDTWKDRAEFVKEGLTNLLNEVAKLTAEWDRLLKEIADKEEAYESLLNTLNDVAQRDVDAVTAERDRYMKALDKILDATSPQYLPWIRDIALTARTALESSQPEGREVTVDKLSRVIHDTWHNEYVCKDLCDDIASRLLEVFDIKRKGPSHKD